MLILGEKRKVVPDPLPLAYSLYAFINVDNKKKNYCELPLTATQTNTDNVQADNPFPVVARHGTSMHNVMQTSPVSVKGVTLV